MSIPPPTSYPPIIVPETLHIAWASGRWSVLDVSGDETPQDYACAPDDSILATVEYGIHDSVPAGLGRSAVMQVRFAYSYPDETWHEHATSDYVLSAHSPGEASFVRVLPTLGALGADPIEPGLYTAWISADNHYLLDISTCLDWTAVGTVEVFDCSVDPASPNLSAIAVPTDPVEGDEISLTALLEGGIHPTGTITFELFDETHPEDPPVSVTEVEVPGSNGEYPSDPYETVTPGPYRWEVTYEGDAHNDPADGPSTPIEVATLFSSLSASDAWTLIEASAAAVPGVLGIAKFSQADGAQVWFRKITP